MCLHMFDSHKLDKCVHCLSNDLCFTRTMMMVIFLTFPCIYSFTGPTVQRTRASPFLAIHRTHYKANDWVRINCSSNEDKTRLRWFINDIEAAPENVKHYRGQPKSLGLQLQLKPNHNSLVLRCRSVSSEVLAESASKLVLESSESSDDEGREAQSVSSSSTASCLDLFLLTLSLSFCTSCILFDKILLFRHQTRTSLDGIFR